MWMKPVVNDIYQKYEHQRGTKMTSQQPAALTNVYDETT